MDQPGITVEMTSDEYRLAIWALSAFQMKLAELQPVRDYLVVSDLIERFSRRVAVPQEN